MNSCPPFVRKTYQLVADQKTNSIISWSNNGKSFTIWETQKFQKHILPQYFKHNNLCSFIRQLNTYGFHKVNAPESVSGLEFAHPYFQCSAKYLLPKICRKSSKKQTVVTTTLPHSLKTNYVSDTDKSLPITDDNVAQTLISLLKRQSESEKLLMSVCKELEETRTIIDTLGHPPKRLNLSGEELCKKRSRQESCPLIKTEPARKAVKNELEDEINTWPLSFDDLFRDSNNTCSSIVREANYSAVPLQPAFDLSQILLDF